MGRQGKVTQSEARRLEDLSSFGVVTAEAGLGVEWRG